MDKNIERGKLRSYFLGGLPENEAKEIDSLIISNEGFEEDLAIAEESLIEEFLEGSLTESETQLFYSNFMISDERLQRVELVRGLKKYASQNNAVPILANDNPETGFFERLTRALNLSPVFGIAAGLIIVVLLGILVFTFRGRQQSSPLEVEYAQLNQNQTWKKESPDTFSKILLYSGASRSSNRPSLLIKKDLKGKVLLDLALRGKPEAEETFDFELRSGERVMFSQKDIPGIQNPYGGELKVLIPAKILEGKTYIVKVIGSAEGRTEQSFSFKVK